MIVAEYCRNVNCNKKGAAGRGTKVSIAEIGPDSEPCAVNRDDCSIHGFARFAG
jgi:hypothetical protein